MSRLHEAGPGPRWWTPLRVVLALTALTFAVGLVQKAPCASTLWRDGEVRYTFMCYSDLPYLYTGRGFAELAWPYDADPAVRARFDVMEYPVGISYWAYGAGWVTHWLAGSPDVAARQASPPDAVSAQAEVARESTLYVAVNAAGFFLLALLTAWLLAGVNPGRPWDAVPFALAPPLALTGLINWDLLAVVLVAGALWAWARGRPLLTGVLIGLGTAAKLYPLFLLGGVLVIAWRRKQWRELGLAFAGAVVAWVVANLPAYLTGPDQWWVFWTFNDERRADLGSIWLALDQAFHVGFSAGTINTWSMAFFLAWCAGVLVLGLRAPSAPRLAQLGFLVVAGFLLVNKVYSPQYVLWLLPLAVLARPRWRDLLIWFAGEAVYFAAVWWYLGGILQAPGADPELYWASIAVRLAAELYLVAVVARDVLRPDRDLVAREVADPGLREAPA